MPDAISPATATGSEGLPAALNPLAQPPLREVRLAVVMYGGVSLSIYMNGVAQELLHLVRATAPVSRNQSDLPSAAELSSTEPVYRALAQLIGSDEALDAVDSKDAEALDGRPALARFVIDILSGSSAGGINGIFLAKALANDQDLTSLGDLWIKEGDIAVLLNDSGSVKDLGKDKSLIRQRPPPSLLNGKRMYLKLLDAFMRMEIRRASKEDDESRLSDELDLYVTTTDLAGLLLPIPLSNRVTWERRYRNVFHFKYAAADATGSHRNDFHEWNNAFLAFAARCTSAFPWAFEPVELEDIRETVSQFPPYASAPKLGSDDAWSQLWQSFFSDYLIDPLGGTGPTPSSTSFGRRAFGDGGALDNKPFSYATGALLRRQPTVPVDRKLLFVEPDPGHPERATDPTGRPDALQNFLEQAVLLPRQETIRDDLQVVFDRNRVIMRVDRVLQDLDEAAWRQGGEVAPNVDLQPARSSAVASRDITEDLERRGMSYCGYHRVRLQAVSDDLATLVVRVAGLPEETQYANAVRYLVVAWRDANYREFLQDGQWRAQGWTAPAVDPPPGTPGTTNRFLAEFDLGYRLRRLNLLQRRIDRLYSLDAAGQRMLAAAGFLYWPADPDARARFRHELVTVKSALAAVHRGLRATGRNARKRPPIPVPGVFANTAASPTPAPGPVVSVADLVRDIGVTVDVLCSVLACPTEEARRDWAADYYQAQANAFDALGRRLAEDLSGAFAEAKTATVAALGATPPPDEAGATALGYLVHSYNFFEDYDSVAFPMLYAADAGEADVVEVIRVGPLDATRLADPNPPGGPAKVTGSRYMHFGAFLSRLWRERDIMWGRLDAAEILIASLLPPDLEHSEHRESQVEDLRKAAQRIIVREQIGLKDRRDLVEALARAATAVPTNPSTPEEILRGLIAAAGLPLDQRTLAVLQLVVEDEDLLLDYVKRTAGVIEPLPPRETLHTMSRGAHIMGSVLNGVAAARQQPKFGLPFAWVGRIGALVTGMVEVATPRSFWHLLGRHWLAVVVVLEVLAIIGGAFLSPAVAQFGTTTLLLTALAVVGVLTVSRFIQGKKRWWVWVAVVTGILLAGMLVLGVFELRNLGRTNDWIPIFGNGSANPSPPASRP